MVTKYTKDGEIRDIDTTTFDGRMWYMVIPLAIEGKIIVQLSDNEKRKIFDSIFIDFDVDAYTQTYSSVVKSI
jgi:hypothetical protein